MKLETFLAQKKHAIIQDWFERVIETYPPDTSKFLKSQKDPFANPVGRTVLRGLEAVFDELLSGMNPEVVNSFLDPVIRIRAVQNFTPSRAVAFIFSLKKVIRGHLRGAPGDQENAWDLPGFESRIDDLGLMAFDIYMECREKLYELKANEVRNRTFKALEKANLVKPGPDDAPDLKKEP
jgi:hypothetical protein